jgi:hypothetical protein
MSSARQKFVAAGLSVAVGAGLAVAALSLDGAGGPAGFPAAKAASLKDTQPLTPAQNRRPLSPHTKRSLSAWADRLVGCLTREGLAVGQPQPGENEIVIRPSVSLAKDPLPLVTQMTSCTKALGDPPAEASVSFERQTKAISLYKPKTCPLPTFPKRSSQ